MFGFTDVAIRGYHSAERKLYVWLQPDKITFIHQITNLRRNSTDVFQQLQFKYCLVFTGSIVQLQPEA